MFSTAMYNLEDDPMPEVREEDCLPSSGKRLDVEPR